jgi:hypothetical protein
MKGVRPGVWIILIVMLLAARRELTGFYGQHGQHRDEIADSIGSIGFFYGPPQADHSNCRVWYLRTSEKGLGLFTRELASGKPTLLQEWETSGASSLRGQSLLPLSPDDRFLPLVVSINAARGALAICEADSGKELIRIKEAGWTVLDSAWLTPERLAWLRTKPGGPGQPPVLQLHLTQRQPDGEWADMLSRVRLTNASCLTALSSNTIGWMDGNGVYALDLASLRVATLWSAQGNQISGVDYCRETRQFLVTCRDKSGFSLWRLEPGTDAPDDFSQLTSDQNIQSAQWMNHGEGYAQLTTGRLLLSTIHLSLL